mgnify:CR=1 FL=1
MIFPPTTAYIEAIIALECKSTCQEQNLRPYSPTFQKRRIIHVVLVHSWDLTYTPGGELEMPSKPPASKKLPGKDFGSPIADSPAWHTSLTIDEKMLALRLMTLLWSQARIAKKLHRDRRIISSFRDTFVDNPSLIVRLPVLYQQGRKSYVCKICGISRDTLEAGYRHVLSHILPIEIARDSPLDLSYLDTGTL